MKRREFVSLIGVAAAWPIAALAQRLGAMRRIVVVGALAPDDVETVKRSAAFEQALAALGWTKGGTIAIEYHWIANDTALAQKTAVEVVALAPDVLLASSNIVIEQLWKATGTIPIVMVQVIDPVGSGYVESMARPGGNVTGFTQFEYSLAGKWLDLLMEIAPRTSRVAVLRDPTRSTGIGQFAVIQAMAPARGVEPIPINTSDVADMERRITAFASVPNGGIIATVAAGANRRAAMIAAANKNRLPTIFPYRYYAADGGLASYGPNTVDQYRRAASYIDRILKGEKPANLPVQGPTKYELTINLKTAKTLGVTVPQSILARADEVIE
ncbi:ABC transporter substrate-binding protein [Bradyrhizobium sp. Tv2a-2]|uniref:ABC transporter substrate-binding protein n=1 Tax=Bradyrhizobium sp. Tv2a-2 TaxID=113395 RepID=UPI00042515B1|nr:ABC transporter substrate-binding protein [Bradyrhizobium sp. Tv2a-2]